MDLIERQAAIDALEKVAELYPWKVPGNRDSYSQYNEAWQDALNRADSEIEALPSVQPEQRWIPCGDRLPEDNSDILVTYVEKDEKRIAPVNYGCGTWFDCLFNKVLDQVGVLAWMPLPEPYKAESEDKE